MMTVAAADAPDSSSNPLINKICIYTFVASVIGVLLAAFLIRSATVSNIVIGLLVLGALPPLGWGLGKGNIVEGVVPAVLGAVGSALGLVALSSVFWGLLVGATAKGVSFGRMILFSIAGCVVGAIVVLILAQPMGQDPNWLMTAFIIWGIIWSCGISFPMSRT